MHCYLVITPPLQARVLRQIAARMQAEELRTRLRADVRLVRVRVSPNPNPNPNPNQGGCILLQVDAAGAITYGCSLYYIWLQVRRKRREEATKKAAAAKKKTRAADVD